jgi:hypothetical protein
LRDLLLRVLVLAGCFTAILTEVLSPFDLLRRGPVMAGWILAVAAAILWVRPRFTRPKLSWGLPEAAIAAAIAAVAIPVGIAAVLSPPNSTDAMAYHLPRVVYWAQAGSVRFFPTPYLNQIMLQPLAEYMMLHQYLLTGSDHFINLIAFAAFLASIIGISALAAALGLGRTGQALAALFCATLPDGILQASGAKNDWLLAFFLVAAVYFAARRELPFAGISLGLALATKATGYLFAPPAILAALILGRQAFTWKTAAWFAAGVLAINTPQYLRNLQLSGSPLGYDSAQGDGFFRWRNEHPGPGAAASNLLRNLSDQLGARSERWNRAVYDGVVRLHGVLGLDPQSPDTTWRWSRFVPPRNSNHEADANNRWHLFLLVLAVGLALWRRNVRWLLYAGALLTGFVLFCFYLKWQPYQARLELPLFVLAAPLGAYLLDSLRPRAATVLICLFLLSGARLPALQNWVRPLKGPYNLSSRPGTSTISRI